MAGINSIQDILKKRGKDFVEKLMSQRVTVNEQLSASTLVFEKRPDGTIAFYKKNGSVAITWVDRVLMRYYEDAIQYIEKLNARKPELIPCNWRFGTEYFVSTQPVRIAYDRLPKNRLVLSYVQMRDESGKVLETVSDKKRLDQWADVLDIERPPIFYQGFLNDRQKRKILDFVYSRPEELQARFKTTSFTAFILSVINPALRAPLLQNDMDKEIEGVVFRFGEDDDNADEVILAKVVDPMFGVQQGSPKEVEQGHASDMFYITLMDVHDFMQDLNFRKIKLKRGTADERYLSFITQAFNMFCDAYPMRYQGVDFDLPKFMQKPEFKLNKELIRDERTRELLDKDPSYEELFKIMLASFRKKRKKEISFFTKEVMTHFNGLVDRIAMLTNPNLSESEQPEAPSGFVGFKEFLYEYSDLGYVNEGDEEDGDEKTTDKEGSDDGISLGGEESGSDKKEEGDDVSLGDDEESDGDEDIKVPDDSGDDDSGDSDEGSSDDSDDSDDDEDDEGDEDTEMPGPDPLRLATFWNKAFNLKAGELSIDFTPEPDEDELEAAGVPIADEVALREEVNVLIGTFQPFHSGHLQAIKDLYSTNGLRVVVVDVNHGEQSGKYPFSTDVIDRMFLKIHTDHEKMIGGFLRVRRALLKDVLIHIDENFKVGVLAVPEDKYDGYMMQAKYAATSLDMNYAAARGMQLVKVTDHIDRVDVIASVNTNDFRMFRNFMPTCLLTFFDVLVNELETLKNKLRRDAADAKQFN
jgi:hypothetical protein